MAVSIIEDTSPGASGPGQYFAAHPAAYRLSLAGAGGTALYAAMRTLRTPGPRRVPWLALAVLEAAITCGIVCARRAATPATAVTGHRFGAHP